MRVTGHTIARHLTVAAALFLGAAAVVSAGDPRALGHGLAAVRLPDGHARLFVSLPTGTQPDDAPDAPDAEGGWTHDILTALWPPAADGLDWQPLVATPEAQEPVSAARLGNGTILVTWEDGWDTPHGVTQRYRVYDDALHRLAPQDDRAEVAPGGHSGHVAATRDQAIVVWSEGWVDHGGVDDLGTGNGVYATVFDAQGRAVAQHDIAPAQRDWWPLVAAGPTSALVVWQSWQPGGGVSLRLAALDPAAARLTGPVAADVQVQPYVYDIAAVAEGRFLLTGAAAAGCGFARLLDGQGRVLAARDDLPPPPREAQALIEGTRAFIPAAQGGATELSLAGDALTLRGWHPGGPAFGRTGTLGLMAAADRIDWLTLGPDGVVMATMRADQPQPPPPCTPPSP